MPELVAILEAKSNQEYEDKKFMAALQGVDLDKSSGKNSGNAWEEMKARVYSKGKTSNPNDVMALRGKNAQRKGFGIGMGLEAEFVDGDKKVKELG